MTYTLLIERGVIVSLRVFEDGGDSVRKFWGPISGEPGSGK